MRKKCCSFLIRARRKIRKVLLFLLVDDDEEFFLVDRFKNTKYQIGEWSYGNPKVVTWGEESTLKIGKFCSIAEGVVILLGGEHRTDWITTYPFNKVFTEAAEYKGHPSTKGDVVIGNDVWIGRDALILSGVTIGDGAVVAARSVIVSDVAPYSVVGGVPAKHIKFRFPEEEIHGLISINWWDWPLHKIFENLRYLLSSNINDFINKNKEF